MLLICLDGHGDGEQAVNDFKTYWVAQPMRGGGNSEGYAHLAWDASRKATLDEIKTIVERKFSEACACSKSSMSRTQMIREELVHKKVTRLSNESIILMELIDELKGKR